MKHLANEPALKTPSANWPIHGDADRDELAAYGLDPDTLLDFSVCVNPYGPSPCVRQALLDVPLNRYPDRKATQLRDALARQLAKETVAGVSVLRNPGCRPEHPGFRSTETPATAGPCVHDRLSPDHILIGNGVSELIWLACLAFLKPSDRVLIPEPTYGEYARSAAMMNAVIVPLRTNEIEGFVVSSDKMQDAMRRCQPRMVFLCNPNNPTGSLLSAATIAGWAAAWPACLFVVDEAYMAFVNVEPAAQARDSAETTLACAAGSDNILVLRSMTKDFALAGLRLGYALGSVEVIDALLRVQPPWSVNAMAQAAGVAALGDLDHRQRTLQLLRQAKALLTSGLTEIGLAHLPSATNFFLVHVGAGAGFRRSLLEHGILVRDCASFGLPEFVRIATRLPEDNRRLIEAIQEIRR